jgi:hypothetical protein
MKNDEEFIYDRIRMLEEIAKLQDTNEENWRDDVPAW